MIQAGEQQVMLTVGIADAAAGAEEVIQLPGGVVTEPGESDLASAGASPPAIQPMEPVQIAGRYCWCFGVVPGAWG